MVRFKKTKEILAQQPKRLSEILEEQLETGMEEHKRSNFGLLLSSFSAGLEIGFSIFLMGVLHTLFAEQLSESVMHVLLAFAYPLGFIFVVIGRSELFTEHTTLAVLPVLDRAASLKSLGVLWGLVFLGNIIGGYLFSLMLVHLAPTMDIITLETFYELAHKMIDYQWSVILGSGILAGWLMGLLSWLVTSSQETISRIFVVILVTTVIGIGGLHHSIVGSIEVFSGYLAGPNITFTDYLNFQLWTTLGNMIGGVVFVAVIKYSHTKRSKEGVDIKKEKRKQQQKEDQKKREKQRKKEKKDDSEHKEVETKDGGSKLL